MNEGHTARMIGPDPVRELPCRPWTVTRQPISRNPRCVVVTSTQHSMQ